MFGWNENPLVKGAFLEPGDMTTCFIPLASHSATIDLATGIFEYFKFLIFIVLRLKPHKFLQPVTFVRRGARFTTSAELSSWFPPCLQSPAILPPD